MIGKTIKFLTKVILWAVFLALIIPVVYFAVRMGKPMDRSEYKGLTYYQYLEWHHLEQEKSGKAYGAAHPTPPEGYDIDVGKACTANALVFGHVGLFLSQGPALILDSILLDRPFDTSHFLSDWWANFEREHLVIMRGNSSGHPICRIPDEIPDDYALSVGAHLPKEEVVQ